MVIFTFARFPRISDLRLERRSLHEDKIRLMSTLESVRAENTCMRQRLDSFATISSSPQHKTPDLASSMTYDNAWELTGAKIQNLHIYFILFVYFRKRKSWLKRRDRLGTCGRRSAFIRRTFKASIPRSTSSRRKIENSELKTSSASRQGKVSI